MQNRWRNAIYLTGFSRNTMMAGLPLEDLRTVFADGDMDLSIKDRAKLMEKRLKEKSSVELKLRKKK